MDRRLFLRGLFGLSAGAAALAVTAPAAEAMLLGAPLPASDAGGAFNPATAILTEEEVAATKAQEAYWVVYRRRYRRRRRYFHFYHRRRRRFWRRRIYFY